MIILEAWVDTAWSTCECVCVCGGGEVGGGGWVPVSVGEGNSQPLYFDFQLSICCRMLPHSGDAQRVQEQLPSLENTMCPRFWAPTVQRRTAAQRRPRPPVTKETIRGLRVVSLLPTRRAKLFSADGVLGQTGRNLANFTWVSSAFWIHTKAIKRHKLSSVHSQIGELCITSENLYCARLHG